MIKRAFTRFRFSRLLSDRREMSLESFFPLWATSDGVYAGPVGPSARVFPEARAVTRVAEDRRISDQELLAALQHPDGKIAAYCFEILFRRRSPLLSAIPPAVAGRPERISHRLGCYVFDCTLGELLKSRSKKTEAEGA